MLLVRKILHKLILKIRSLNCVAIFCQMVDNKGWKCVVLKTCKNYFLSLFKTLKLFIIIKLKKATTTNMKKKKQLN